MKTTISYTRIWQIAYPIILGSIAQNLINFTDTAFLGRVGEIALGAGALGGLLYLAFIMLGLGFGTGAQIIIARRFGENNMKQIGPVVEHSIYFLLPLALLVFLLMRYGSVFMLQYAVASQEVYEATIDFLKYRSFGIFFAFINMVFRSFYVGLAKTKVITYTTIVLAITNIIFDYLLIFGHYGFPELGIEGAAIASVIAEAVAMLFFIAYTYATIRFKDYDLFCFCQVSLSRLKRILTVAVPIMMQSFLSLFVWFIFFLFIEKLGESSLAVSNIIRSIFVVLMMPIWGFSTATNTLVSYLIGQQRSGEVMSLILKIVRLCFLGVLAIVSIGLIFPEYVLSVYTNNAALIELGIPILYVVSIGALFLSIGFIFFNGVSGTGKTNVSLLIELIVLVIYLSYAYTMVYVAKVTIAGVWTTEILYGIMLAVFSFIYLKKGRWGESRI
ncbi:MAG: MATE family efflux transporter [Bacteroidales bacterium]|jgi:putative MATE family efflux protein|nr:MATE family efflux transporter [Bacteroidales bacterium]